MGQVSDGIRRREGRWQIFPRQSRRGAYQSRLELARSVAVRLDAELADLRRAIEAIHCPKAVGSSDPEDPTIICQTCRCDYPCETRSFSDRLDPINAIDEFSDQPDPF